mmetsp:Transcript_25719/g.39858  ORF Transcript_25719/g.39858 Transcript_25719/m.39858 type:complete len:450 (-) Transcript_25719:182-1531(-)
MTKKHTRCCSCTCNTMANTENEDNQTTKTPAPTATAELMIRDRCSVKWRDGTLLPAEIVERRPIRRANTNHTNTKKTKRDADNTDEADKNGDPNNTDQQHNMEYYVHYLNHDRRLDEWCSISRFQLDTLDSSHRHVSLQKQHTSSRKRKSTASDAMHKANQELAELEREHEEMTKVKNIHNIVIGNWDVETWYFSPYPSEFSPCETLFICEFCLKYMKHKCSYRKHKECCEKRRPPGREIYRENNLSVFEIDGKENRVYCQNLCLLAKLFLDHKTLYYDVDPFWFYIVTEVDNEGAHVVGYFSKEKVSAEDYNLACILTFPQHQKSGYGKFIISLSYELSKREKKVGSPEKPLSDLGKISYRSYWTHVLMHLLSQSSKQGKMKSLSIKAISTITAIKVEDILSTFQSLNMIQYWKGQHVIKVRQDLIKDYMKNSKPIRLCKSEYLTWEK